jgi:hypothetical protein
MSKRYLVAAVCALPVLIWAGPAHADVAGSMTAELSANGVPSPMVSIITPPPATASDVAAFEADPSGVYPTLTPTNILSPDPTNPMPVAQVSYSPVGPPHDYPGALTAPEQRVYVEDAETPVWSGAVVEAVKHAVAGGAPIAGVVAYGPAWPGRDATQPDVYVPVPDSSTYSAAGPPQTMTTGAVQLQYQLGLASAYAGASVSVVDASGGQRVVTITFDQSAAAFANDNLAQLTSYADGMQAQLNDPVQGANVGEVIVRSRDPVTQTPLFTHAADVGWGEKFEWSAPIIKAYTDPASTDSEEG